MQLFEEPFGLVETTEEAKIVAHHDNGIKRTRLEFRDLVDGPEPDIFDATQLADLHRASRIVDAGDVESLLLQVQQESSCAAANVQYATPRQLDGLALALIPVTVVRKISARCRGRIHQTIVSFDDLPARIPRRFVRRQQLRSESVLFSFYRRTHLRLSAQSAGKNSYFAGPFCSGAGGAAAGFSNFLSSTGTFCCTSLT